MEAKIGRDFSKKQTGSNVAIETRLKKYISK